MKRLVLLAVSLFVAMALGCNNMTNSAEMKACAEACGVRGVQIVVTSTPPVCVCAKDPVTP